MKKQTDIAPPSVDQVLLIARSLIVLVFLISGIQKSQVIGGVSSALSSAGVPIAQTAAWGAVILEITCAVMVMLGLYSRLAALMLICFTMIATVLFHPFWLSVGTDASNHLVHALKNIGLIGGLLLLARFGPGRYSIEAMARAHAPRLRTMPEPQSSLSTGSAERLRPTDRSEIPPTSIQPRGGRS